MTRRAPKPRPLPVEATPTDAVLPVLTGSETRALEMALVTFSGLGSIDPAFARLARWHLVTIARGNDPRFWFANTTSLGRDALKEMGRNA
jgi:hypothetical protein